jgi:hypothetical protein
LKLTRYFLFICFPALILTSCSTFSSVEKRKYRSGYFLQGFLSSGISKKDWVGESKSFGLDKKDSCENLSMRNDIKPDTIPTPVVKDSVLTINPIVGDTISNYENLKYCIFPFWKKNKLLYGQFIEEDSLIYFDGTLKNGKIKTKFVSRKKYQFIADHAFQGNGDYSLSRFILHYSWLAIGCLSLSFLIFPLFFFGLFSLKAFKYSKALKALHPTEKKYFGKNDATFGTVIGIIGYVFISLATLLLTYYLFSVIGKLI